MTHVFDVTALLSLLWPLALCAVAWGIMVWALRQRDAISKAVDWPLDAGSRTRRDVF